MPEKRYLGAFGVTAWATKSGSGLLSYGEKVGIERTKPTTLSAKIGRGAKVIRSIANKRQDVVVRFTNSKGEEVGRLENETAAWISTLLDQKICSFEGLCVFAPEKIRTNDTVYLQLRCFLLMAAFEVGRLIKQHDTNRESVWFESKESNEERDLRLRQVAMVKLFDEINLQPSRVNAQTEKHKRQGLLQAAEVAEQNEQQRSTQAAKSSDNGGSSPPSEESEEGEELEQDQLDALYKKAQSFDFNTPEAEPAETFAMTLRKYQKQALHWMVGKEKDEKAENKQQSMHPLWEEYVWPTKDVDEKALPEFAGLENFYVNPYSGEMSLDFPVQEQNCLGGILADEMGLGKTIEMLSLIHSHKAEIATSSVSRSSVNDLPRLRKDSSAVERAPATTLVVAPMSLLTQWQSEAEKASKTGSLQTLVYYGTEKNANLQSLCCSANAANCPNLIITSYGVVLSEFNQVAAMGGSRGSHDGLFSLEYFRIILDEAHVIKNRLSKTAKACYELKALHRWVLTGTPIVNRLEDLFSLVHFLKVEPWSNFSFWKTFITVPFESKDFLRALDVVQTVLEPLVLRRTKDMRTPSGEALIPLPPRTIQIAKIQLSKPEREVYEHIFMRAKRTFNANIEAGTLLKSYTTIFAQILRLRQSCCHPLLTRNKTIVAEEEDAAAAADLAAGLADDMDLDVLIEQFTAEAEEEERDANAFGAHVLRQIQQEAEMECPICSEEPMMQQGVTGCWHSACKGCLLDYIEHQREKGEVPRCFNCREPINARDVFEVIRHESDLVDGTLDMASSSQTSFSLRRVGCDASAKIAGLLGHLKKIRRERPGMKMVVFSQFTSFLDLIEPALTRDRIPYLRFDGTMAQKQRAAVLEEFNDTRRGVVLLLSLRAGGVGLNLTAAKRVFMMDPWWSFAVEAQAIDRVHRMGQEDEVVVTRFIVEGSIEEKMLKVQERKKFM
jgi:DNA repair protein RAD5